MRLRDRAGALAVAAAILPLGACGGSATDDGASTALPASTPSRSLAVAAALERCPAVEGSGSAELPDAPLPCLGAGPPVRLSALGGTPAVVNVWATWCGPCRDELPLFQWLHDTASDRVRVLGVLYEDDPGGGAAFARKLGVRFPSVVDTDGQLKAARVVGLPATFFVAADGTTSLKLGEVKSRAELRDLVTEHLRVRL